MKRVFKELNKGSGSYQIKAIDMEENTMTLYMQDKRYGLGFPFGSVSKRTCKDWGYKDAKDCIKKLKARGLLINEVDYKEQLQSEKIGLINLGVDRIKRHGKIDTNNFTDIIERLKKYGLGFVDAQNMIIGSYLYAIGEN